MHKKIGTWMTRAALLPLSAALILGTSAPSWAGNPSHTAKKVLPKECLNKSYKKEVEMKKPQKDMKVYSKEKKHQGYKHYRPGAFAQNGKK